MPATVGSAGSPSESIISPSDWSSGPQEGESSSLEATSTVGSEATTCASCVGAESPWPPGSRAGIELGGKFTKGSLKHV